MQLIESQILFITPIILFFASFILFILFVQKAVKTRQKMFYYLSILFFLHLLSRVFQIGQYIALTVLRAEFNFIMNQILHMLLLYTLVLILEFYSQNILFSGKQTIIAILVFLTIGGMISTPNLTEEIIEGRIIITFNSLSPVMIFQILFYISASVWIIYLLYSNRKAADKSKQKILMIFLFIGFILAVFIPIVPNILNQFFGKPPERSLLLTILSILLIENAGILIIGIAFYWASKNPWLLQQQQVYLLAVYSPDGVELYSKTFTNKISKDDILLLSGGFTAIGNLFKEATDAEGSIKAILLEDKELRLINKKDFISALLVDYSTQATKEAHNKFSEMFQKQFEQELKQFSGEISSFNKSDQISNKLFY